MIHCYDNYNYTAIILFVPHEKDTFSLSAFFQHIKGS